MYDDILGPRKKCQWEDVIIYSPYIPLQIQKIVVKAKPRKLKAKWTQELSIEKELIKNLRIELGEEFQRELIKNAKIELGYDVLKEMNEC